MTMPSRTVRVPIQGASSTRDGRASVGMNGISAGRPHELCMCSLVDRYDMLCLSWYRMDGALRYGMVCCVWIVVLLLLLLLYYYYCMAPSTPPHLPCASSPVADPSFLHCLWLESCYIHKLRDGRETVVQPKTFVTT
jgi:hypothetical protein